MVTGALTTASIIGFTAVNLPAYDERTLFDQLFMIIALACATCAMCGPVFLGSVLYINAYTLHAPNPRPQSHIAEGGQVGGCRAHEDHDA